MNPELPAEAYPYLEAALPGFHRGWVLVKAAGDSPAGPGFIGTNFDFYRFTDRLQLAACLGGLCPLLKPSFDPRSH